MSFLKLGPILWLSLTVLFFDKGLAANDVERGEVTAGASGLDIPRFVALDTDKAYMRAGPGLQYPIDWIYQRKMLPLLVIDEYESWRKVRDAEGVTGWMHVYLLTGERTALITGGRQRLFKKPDPTSRLVMTAGEGVTGLLLDCERAWCRLDLGNDKGWVKRDSLWGIFEGEEY